MASPMNKRKLRLLVNYVFVLGAEYTSTSLATLVLVTHLWIPALLRGDMHCLSALIAPFAYTTTHIPFSRLGWARADAILDESLVV